MAKTKYDLVIKSNSDPDINTLVLMKFPAMRSQFENPADLVSLSFKPKAMKFKLELELDKTAPSYHRSATVQLDRSGKVKAPDEAFFNKNCYTSTKVPIDDGQLFACKVVNNQLVCYPVSHILTMRSDFSHMDVKDEPDPNQEIRPVSVKFSSTDRQSNAARPANSNQTDEDEAQQPYLPMTYKPLASREATAQRDALFGKQIPNLKPDPDLELDNKKPHITMPDIKPKVEPVDYENEAYPADSNSQPKSQSTLSADRKKMVQEVIRECLFKAKIVSFPEVYNFVRQSKKGTYQDVSTKDILDALADSALLVQGNWAIKSETLYGGSKDRDSTDTTGISINLFIAARDYLLYLFDQNRLVSRLEFSQKVRMPDHDILELFNQLAVLRRDLRKWELKLPTDEKFLDQFPDVVQRQATFWKVRRANKLSIFNV